MATVYCVLGDVTMGLIGLFLLLAHYANDSQMSSQQANMRNQGATSTSEETFKSDLTDVSGADQPSAQEFTLPTLTVDGAGRNINGLVLDGDKMQLSALTTAVRQRRIKRLRLRGNPDIAHQVIMDIKHLCREAGVESFEDVRFRQSSTL